jgi:hypothetical protein
MTSQSLVPAPPAPAVLAPPIFSWVKPLPRPTLPAHASSIRARTASAVTFVLVCLGLVAISGLLAINGVGLAGWPAFLGIFGIPAAAILGWTFGPRAGWGTHDEAVPLCGQVALLAVLIGDVTVVLAFAIPVGWADGGILAVAIICALVGLVLFGIPALIVILPASLAWIAILRIVVAPRIVT